MSRVAATLLCSCLTFVGGEAVAAPAVRVFPTGEAYPSYVADPRQPEFAVTILGYTDPSIIDSGNRRFGLKLGGRFGLLRFEPAERPERGWQLDIEAGFNGQFDIEHSLDNIGWDGLYSLLLSTSLTPDVSLQLGAKHVSSHVGDEYAERTGRKRIGYTREELAAGAAWAFAPRWRGYAEAGWSVSPKEEVGQEPGRLQLGAVHEAPGTLAQGKLGWYAAANLGSMEERDWQLDASAEIGFLVPARDRLWRFGLAVHDGTVPIGEFFRDDETYFALGLWLEP